MAAPADRLANIVSQDIGLTLLTEFESKAKRLNYKKYLLYPYKDERAVTGTVEVNPQSSAVTIRNRRMLRILGCMLDVSWNTDLATTKTAVAAAVTALTL